MTENIAMYDEKSSEGDQTSRYDSGRDSSALRPNKDVKVNQSPNV